MKDQHDKSTIDILGDTMYKVNFQYAHNLLLRSGSLVIPAKSAEEARKIATEKLKELYPDTWHKITSHSKLQ